MKPRHCSGGNSASSFRFLLGQQLGDEIGTAVIVEREAEFELAHERQKVGMQRRGVVPRREQIGEVAAGQLAILRLQFGGIEQVVDALGDPLRIEHAEAAQRLFLAVGEHQAERVQTLRERLLILTLSHAALVAKGAEILEGQPVPLRRGQFFLHAPPIGWPLGLESRHRPGQFADARPQLFDSVAGLAVGLEEDEAASVLVAEQFAIELEVRVVPLVKQHDHRRVVAGEGAHQREPVFGVVILGAFARGDEHKVKRPLGHEKAVRAMHDLLPAEVPHVRLHIVAVDFQRPARDLDPRRALEGLVLPGGQPVDQRGLPHAAAPD